MSDPVQIVPFLTAMEDTGEFTLRVDDSPLAKAVAPLLLKAIGEVPGARKLTLITPADLKVYRFNGKLAENAKGEEGKMAAAGSPPSDSPPPPGPVVSQDESAPPSPEAVAEYERQVEQFEARRAKPKPGVPGSEANRGGKPKAEAQPKPESPCGRCGGSGSILNGGTCPVCQGRGTIVRFGRRRG